MSTTFKSVSKSCKYLNRFCGVQYAPSTHSKRSIFGPSETDWNKWSKEFDFDWENPNLDGQTRDPREATAQDIKEKLKYQGKFVIDSIPILELPDNAWYSSNHLYIQQTNLDDIWRIGFSPIRFTGTRWVEWLVYDCDPGDIKLHSEALMWYSICDWKPLRAVGQSINDIQWTLQSPFHRIQIVSVNEKISNQCMTLIDDDIDINWRFLCVFRWINKHSEIFSQPPIAEGRHGKWFDEEQYIEWIKDEGLYKAWQIDQVMKLAEDKKLQTISMGSSHSAKEDRDKAKWAEMRQGQYNHAPKYQQVDKQYGEGGRTRSWKPKWFPF